MFDENLTRRHERIRRITVTLVWVQSSPAAGRSAKERGGEDIEGALINISVELPKLLDRRARAVAVFTERGTIDLQAQVDACVELLEDLKIRADFINKLRSFYEMLGLLEHRPEVPGDVFRDAKLLGFINKVAANLYRDPALNLFGVAEKVNNICAVQTESSTQSHRGPERAPPCVAFGGTGGGVFGCHEKTLLARAVHGGSPSL